MFTNRRLAAPGPTTNNPAHVASQPTIKHTLPPKTTCSGGRVTFPHNSATGKHFPAINYLLNNVNRNSPSTDA